LHVFTSEFFHEQVDEQQQGDDADDDCFHGALLQLVAEAHIKSAHYKKRDDGPEKD
jgi:hypothetical protein